MKKFKMKGGQNNMNGKRIALAILFVASVLIVATVVAAAGETLLLCPGNGDVIEFSKCNPSIGDFRCNSDVCQLCAFRTTSGVYCPRSLNSCNSLGLSCSLGGGNTSVDGIAPILSVGSPIDGTQYRTESVLVNLTTNEAATFYYRDLTTSRWVKLSGKPMEIKQFVKFKEGENRIVFRAVDRNSNIVEINKTFFIDSKIPQIISTEPRKGDYANGNFHLEFKEENPKTITLHLGNGSGNSYNVDFSKCVLDRTKGECDTTIDLSGYNGTVDYWFTVEDLVGNVKSSRRVSIKVDTQRPLFDKLNYTIQLKRVSFDILLSEKADLEYMDNSASRPRWISMCRNCNKFKGTKSFSIGNHEVVLRATDKAGNFNSQTISLVI